MKTAGKQIALYPAETLTAPLIVMNSVVGNGEAVWKKVQKLTDRDFSLINISGLRWDDDMTPWPCPPITKGDTPCSGEADSYLKDLLEEIIPEARRQMQIQPAWIGIAGYSLAGLFALYSLYRTDLFARAASASGSFWYPDFRDFAMNQEMKRKPDCLYFSLGDQEAETSNPYLKTVRKNTEAMQEFFASKGIADVFELNPGSHFKDGNTRMAKGIAWILNQDA